MKLTTNQQILVMDWLLELVGEARAIELIGSFPGYGYDRETQRDMVEWQKSKLAKGTPRMATLAVIGLDKIELNPMATEAYKAWRKSKKSAALPNSTLDLL